MSKREWVTPEGLRGDGRRARELRRLRVELGVLPHADGSACVEMGNTKVLAAVFGPRVPPGRPAASSDAAPVDVRCEYAAAAFATGGERRKRLRRDRRAAEAAAVIRDAVAASVLTTAATRGARLDVGVQVLADGGGALAAALNAAAAALGDAGVPLADLLAACGATALDGATLLDPSDAEERGDGPAAVVAAWTTRGGLAAVHTDRAAPPDALADLIAACEDGAAAAGVALRDALLAKAGAAAAAAGGFCGFLFFVPPPII